LTAKQTTIPDAQQVFDGVAENYERPAQIFGLGQYHYWHRELAKLVATASPSTVLDMCTGTGLIAAELRRRTQAKMVGADLSRGMLRAAMARGVDAALVQADARHPPFTFASFDAVVFSYLLRYVEDVPATLNNLAALVRPGGLMASLEFGVPKGVWKAPWQLYTRALMPVGLTFVSPGWRHVGAFLGRSIAEFYQRWPVERQVDAWRRAGVEDIQARSLSLGGGQLIWGTRQ
jgi:demethylmenaquinone methyltransferase/2-methoxy-6-polyprenyl-1,4-benzoquinol methylase